MSSGPKKITRDHYLFREGDAPDAMYVVKSGKLAVVKSKQTSEIILAEIGPGAMVGEMAFFDNKPRSASVKAMKDSEVIALPYKALHAQFQNFPEWCKAIMRTVNNHLRNANQRIRKKRQFRRSISAAHNKQVSCNIDFSSAQIWKILGRGQGCCFGWKFTTKLHDSDFPRSDSQDAKNDGRSKRASVYQTGGLR